MSIPQVFTDEQKQYLQGFMTGALQRGVSTSNGQGGVPFASGTGGVGAGTGMESGVGAETAEVFGTPAEDLCKEEQIKLEHNGLDIWDRIVANADKGLFPEGGDNFRYKFHGLFYVAPAQDAFMIRLRTPACQLSAQQFAGLGRAAELYGGGYSDITTRGNLQIREIKATDAARMLLHVDDLGLTSRGSGADNLRNITASPTCGFDPHEVYDTRPLAKALHHYILNHRDMYGLPRKFNVSFDNGGDISVVADTNDIAFYPVRVLNDNGVEPGVYFRVQLGGITGHLQFASDTGLLLRPEECVPTAIAMIRVFIENGDRTNRKRARLKYLLDKWGVERFLEESETKLGYKLKRFPLEDCEPRRKCIPHGWVGFHPQKQEGKFYLGVAIPVGRMQASQMKQLAKIAELYGSGDIRLTVWQNLIIPDIDESDRDAVTKAIREIGFDVEASSILGGIVACTGNQGCKYAGANTKGHALIIAHHLNKKFDLPHPINIHLTGCAHSCAQHYCGDIGLMGIGVKRGDKTVEGYNIVLGGGVDDQQGIGRDFLKSVPFDEVNGTLEKLLAYYLDKREEDETFLDFTRRQEMDTLIAAVEN